jgi:hypothetical protein
MSKGGNGMLDEKKGFLEKIFGGKKKSCCNTQIIEIDEHEEKDDAQKKDERT